MQTYVNAVGLAPHCHAQGKVSYFMENLHMSLITAL